MHRQFSLATKVAMPKVAVRLKLEIDFSKHWLVAGAIFSIPSDLLPDVAAADGVVAGSVAGTSELATLRTGSEMVEFDMEVHAERRFSVL